MVARRGDLEAGERLAREAVEIAEQTDYLSLRGTVTADLAEVLRLAGRTEEASAAAQLAIGLFRAKGNTAGEARLAESFATV